jgi:hypothetical protein
MDRMVVHTATDIQNDSFDSFHCKDLEIKTFAIYFNVNNPFAVTIHEESQATPQHSQLLQPFFFPAKLCKSDSHGCVELCICPLLA